VPARVTGGRSGGLYMLFVIRESSGTRARGEATIGSVISAAVKWWPAGADATNTVGVPGGSSHVPFRPPR
jgi:hypothetical protein